MMDPRRTQLAAGLGCVLAVATRAQAQQIKFNPHLHHNRGAEPTVEVLRGILDSALQQQAATQPTRKEWH
jgi:hypothetical protein